ncbi:hypothetical protein T12_8702 [Trichinella patagoniensis]|uniref:Uncharacterized protein n=1 Tax=Trichinella patagoniensis TaxID=990121 RepID=A0A0V0Z4Y9_9BILA|nr:hypothetical protein T12_8702 [Trichinella patagoniensis]
MRKKNKATISRPVLEDQEGVRWNVTIISSGEAIVGFLRYTVVVVVVIANKYCILFCALSARMLPTKRELGKRGGRAGSNRTDDTDAEMNLQVNTGASKTVGVPAPMSSPLPGDRPSDGCGRLAGLLGCFFGEPPAASFLLLYPVLPTHDTGFRPAASASPVVTKGFGTCDSLPVVLGASPSSPTTPEFVGAQGQLPATPGFALSVPVSWPPLAHLRLESWLHTAFRLVGTGRQRSGVVVQAGSRKFLSHLSALWSVRAVNVLPYRYGRKRRVAQTRASISRRVAQYFFSGCDSERLAYATTTGRP